MTCTFLYTFADDKSAPRGAIKQKHKRPRKPRTKAWKNGATAEIFLKISTFQPVHVAATAPQTASSGSNEYKERGQQKHRGQWKYPRAKVSE